MATQNDVIKTLMTMGVVYDKAMNEAAAEMLLSDLSDFSPDAILDSLKKCRQEVNRFPSIADIISRAQSKDGRPGVEEAWALLPKDESTSAVWTNEMAEAFGSCSSLMSEDRIAARMAFKETYETLIKNARQIGKPVKWIPSFGTDKLGREAALRVAIDKNRITLGHAQSICPEFEIKKTQTLIGEEQRNEIQKLIEGSFK